ncbi:Holo-[acyl-carrier-protein] synthase [Trichinella pseudospiralis]
MPFGLCNAPGTEEERLFRLKEVFQRGHTHKRQRQHSEENRKFGEKYAGRESRQVTGSSNHKHQKLPAEPNACDGPKVPTVDPRLLL